MYKAIKQEEHRYLSNSPIEWSRSHHGFSRYLTFLFCCSFSSVVLTQDLRGGAGSYPFAAGLRYDIDYTQAFGSRISNIQVNPRLENADFAPLEEGATYNVVTNSFVAGGRDGYFTFTDDAVAATFEDIGVEYGQSFVNYIESVDGPLQDPMPGLFSTQTIVTSNGEVCDAADLIEVTEAPSASPTTEAPDDDDGDNSSPTFLSAGAGILFGLVVAWIV